MDETGGTIAADIIGGNDGVHAGGPLPVAGKVDGSLSFDGLDDEILVSSTFQFHQPGDATLEFWLKTPATGHQSVFWTRANNSDTNRFNIFINGDSTFGFDYRSPSGTLHILVGQCCTGSSIPRNTWVHLAIVRTINIYDLYLNGIFAASATDVSPDLPTSTGWQVSGRGGFMYKGNIDEVGIYNRALSPSEIQDIFNADSAGKCKGVGEDCGDGIDNDEDGLVDCEDPDCIGNPACVCQCSDTCPDKGCISGRVENVLTGQPQSGRVVQLIKIAPAGPGMRSMNVVTNDDGCYRFEGLEDGTYRVKVKPCKGGKTKTVVITGGGKANDVTFQCK